MLLAWLRDGLQAWRVETRRRMSGVDGVRMLGLFVSLLWTMYAHFPASLSIHRSIPIRTAMNQKFMSTRFIIFMQLLSLSCAATSPNPLHNVPVLSKFMTVKSGIGIKSPFYEKENIHDVTEVATLEATINEVSNIAYITPNVSPLLSNIEDMQQVLQNAQFFKKLVNNKLEIMNKGWKMVHEGKEFMLWKRKVLRLDGSDGPIEYLMTGELKDISPFSFLAAQIHRSWRNLWDSSMKEMSKGKLFIERNNTINVTLPHQLNSNNNENIAINVGCKIPLSKSSDSLYYRTKWPWPLKDRDYTLSRRCQIFDEENAFVFVSRSSPSSLSEGREETDIPAIDGVVRVDNYWCQSVVFSTAEKHHLLSTTNRKEGMDDANTGRNNNDPTSDISKSFGDIVEDQWKKMLTVQQHKQDNLKHIFPSIGTSHSQHSNHPYKSFNWSLKTKEMLGHNHFDIVSDRDRHLIADKEKISLPSLRPINSLNKPGLIFVTRFCDDQKMPLPSRLVDILASAGEKLVPESIAKLCDVARKMDKDDNFARNMHIPDADAGKMSFDASEN